MLARLKKNKKGFTLAELLIVVAIIGVLVAISIPIFTTQLEKARDATTLANLRSAYAEAVSLELIDPTVGDTSGNATYTADNTVQVAHVDLECSDGQADLSALQFGSLVTLPTSANKDATVTFVFDNNGNISSVTIN